MTAGRRRVFLHVGCPKTGTTFLQSTLWRSRDALRQEGVELPLDRQSHFQLALAIREQLDPELDPPRAFTVLDRLAEALAGSSAPTILLSNEMLAGATAEQAARLRRLVEAAVAGAELHLIVTARDLTRQVPAEWQQQIQHRRTISWEDFLRSLRDGSEPAAYFLPAQDAADIADRWAAELTPDRVHIVTVPPPPAPRELLLERFCSVLGVGAGSLSGAVAVPNESLGRVQAELLRRVNVALGDRLPHPRAGFGRVGKRYFAHQVLAPMGGERQVLPGAMRPWCDQHTERIIAAVESAGYDVVGDLAELRAAPAPDADQPPIDDAAVADAAVAALAELLDQRHRDLRLIDDLRARLREQRSRPAAGASSNPVAGVER